MFGEGLERGASRRGADEDRSPQAARNRGDVGDHVQSERARRSSSCGSRRASALASCWYMGERLEHHLELGRPAVSMSGLLAADRSTARSRSDRMEREGRRAVAVDIDLHRWRREIRCFVDIEEAQRLGEAARRRIAAS